MAEEQKLEQPGTADEPARQVPFGSNEVRLRGRQWLVAIAVLVGLFVGLPALWEYLEPFEPGADYRLPYALSDDYWHFSRYCRHVAVRGHVPVVGDSVIWGEYVRPDQTLSHWLNELGRGTRFANLGVDGTHPAALAGLIDHYGDGIRDRAVLLHCNLLWMSSKRRDLQVDREMEFNHPELVPQFAENIPCYKATITKRFGIVVERKVPFVNWVRHLQCAYFQEGEEAKALPEWTLAHPYENPVSRVTLQLPQPATRPHSPPMQWRQRSTRKQHLPWVDLEQSSQWLQFRRTVQVLRDRGNQVFVLVGPFNEHLLAEESLAAYRRMREQAAAWLRRERIPHLAPEPLPTELYADASHPLTEGYQRLAQRLLADEGFRSVVQRSGR